MPPHTFLTQMQELNQSLSSTIQDLESTLRATKVCGCPCGHCMYERAGATLCNPAVLKKHSMKFVCGGMRSHVGWERHAGLACTAKLPAHL